MSDLLKSVIQDLINDRTEQAQVSLHDYIVGKTQQLAGLTEAQSVYTFKVGVRAPDKNGGSFKDHVKGIMPKGGKLISYKDGGDGGGNFVFSIKCSSDDAADEVQSEISDHDYVFGVGDGWTKLTEATTGPSKLGKNILWSTVKPGKYLVDVNAIGTYAPNIRPAEITAVSKEIGEPGSDNYTPSKFTVTDLVTGKELTLKATYREVWPWNPTWINAEIERLRRELEKAPASTKEKRQKDIAAYEKLV